MFALDTISKVQAIFGLGAALFSPSASTRSHSLSPASAVSTSPSRTASTPPTSPSSTSSTYTPITSTKRARFDDAEIDEEEARRLTRKTRSNPKELHYGSVLEDPVAVLIPSSPSTTRTIKKTASIARSKRVAKPSATPTPSTRRLRASENKTTTASKIPLEPIASTSTPPTVPPVTPANLNAASSPSQAGRAPKANRQRFNPTQRTTKRTTTKPTTPFPPSVSPSPTPYDEYEIEDVSDDETSVPSTSDNRYPCTVTEPDDDDDDNDTDSAASSSHALPPTASEYDESDIEIISYSDPNPSVKQELDWSTSLVPHIVVPSTSLIPSTSRSPRSRSKNSAPVPYKRREMTFQEQARYVASTMIELAKQQDGDSVWEGTGEYAGYGHKIDGVISEVKFKPRRGGRV